MRGTDQDFARRKSLEDALRENAELFEGVFKQAAVGIALTGPDRKILRANRKICDLLGYGIDELVGTTLRARTHPDFVAQVDEQIRRLVDAEVESATIDNLYVRKDGTTVWGEWTSSLIRDAHGAPKIFVSIIQNIDDRKRAEAEARKTREMLEHSQRAAHLGSWDLEIAEDIERWSDEAYRIFGLEPQSVAFTADGFLDHVHPDDRDIAEKAQNMALEQHKPYSVEYRLVRPDGTERVVYEYAELEFDEQGVPIRLSGTIQDITERKRAEEELARLNAELEQRVDERTVALRAAQEELLRSERLAALGQLTAIVSHELRNPLGAIRTSMYVVEKETEGRNERLLQSIARINRNITRCDRIIDELLDYTRIRDLDVHDIPVDDWLGSVLDEQPVPEGVRIERKFATGGIVIAADADRLRRAVVNVYDNACQAMAGLVCGGGPRRKAQLTVQSRVRNDRVELIFTDNGPGIPEDMIERIFEPLFSTKSFGIGLGLAVVRQIMEQHGGGVEIEGTRSGGTGFMLWLPLSLAVRTASP